MKKIVNEITKSDNIVILCHKNPDGDAVGSSLALYNALKLLNKNVDVVIKDAPIKFRFLDGFSDIKSDSDKKYNLGIILDTAKLNMVNASENLLNNIDKKLIMDHHISNANYGDINLVMDLPACTLIVYKILKKLKVEINKSIADAIITGTLTDTGGLSYGNLGPETFEIICELSRIVSIPEISKKAIGTITKTQFEMKKLAIKNLEFYCNDRIAFSYITEDDLTRLGGRHDECNVLVNIPREIEGVEVCLFFKQFDNGLRISIRSLHINVNEIASLFGGGGHINAGGITIDGEYNAEELKFKLLKEIEAKLDEWDNSCK